MEFKQGELIEREIEIAGYLVQHFSIKHISDKTGLSKKLVVVHIKNMMEKLSVANRSALLKLLGEKLTGY